MSGVQGVESRLEGLEEGFEPAGCRRQARIIRRRLGVWTERSGQGDLVLTEAGQRFAHLETDARKKLFAEHLINYVPVMGLIRRVLDERPSHTAPAARFRNELEDYMAEDQADETLKTIVSWARYAELFAYDEQSETFSLENPN